MPLSHPITDRRIYMKFLSDKYLAARYEVARATVWRWVREGKFPAPVKIGSNCTRWRLADVEAWESAQELAI